MSAAQVSHRPADSRLSGPIDILGTLLAAPHPAGRAPQLGTAADRAEFTPAAGAGDYD